VTVRETGRFASRSVVFACTIGRYLVDLLWFDFRFDGPIVVSGLMVPAKNNDVAA
jgi:hypothetical protein